MPCSELSVALKIRFTANPRGESTSGKRAKAPVYAAYVEVSCLVPRGDGYYSPAAISERSAARLAHQSGGLGVPSSNLGAPTRKILDSIRFPGGSLAAVGAQKPNEKRQNPPIGGKKSRTKSRTCSEWSRSVPPTPC